MSGLYTSIPETSAAPRRRDDDEGAMPPAVLSADHPLIRSYSDGAGMDATSPKDDLGVAPAEAMSRWMTDEPEPSVRKPSFDTTASYRVAQAGAVVASDGDPTVDNDTAVQVAAAGAHAAVEDPTENWTPRAVVDKAIEKRREAGKPVDLAFANRLLRVLTEEQGFADSKDPKDVTNRGVTQETLDALIKKGKIENLPKTVRELKPEDYYNIYHDEYFVGKKVDRLAGVPKLAATEPKLVEQMFDIAVLHASTRGPRWLQESLNESGIALTRDSVARALRADGIRNRRPYTELEIKEMLYNGLVEDEAGALKLKEDGDLGPMTRAVVDIALQAGKIHAVNDSVVRKRVRFMTGHPDLTKYPGWISRALRQHTPNPPSGRTR